MMSIKTTISQKIKIAQLFKAYRNQFQNIAHHLGWFLKVKWLNLNDHITKTKNRKKKSRTKKTVSEHSASYGTIWTTISRRLKIRKFIFHSFQNIRQHFGPKIKAALFEEEGGLHVVNNLDEKKLWEKKSCCLFAYVLFSWWTFQYHFFYGRFNACERFWHVKFI